MPGSPEDGAGACLFALSFLSILPLRCGGVSTEDNVQISGTTGYPSGPPGESNASGNKQIPTATGTEMSFCTWSRGSPTTLP